MSTSAPLPPHLDPRGRRHARASQGHGRSSVARPLGRVLGAGLSVVLLVLAGYYWYTFREIDQAVPRLGGLTVGKAPSGTTQDIDGKDQNILLVGNDDRSTMTNAEVRQLRVGRDGGSLNTDTMMIVHVPADGSKATLISLPRDSYVHIAGYGMGRLNSAYADAYNAVPIRRGLTARRTAGANLLVSTVADLTGLTINHYIQIDLLGFYRISNAIGGVTVNLCHAVDDKQYSGLVLSKGRHTIEGVQALEFVRQRHGLPDGDLDRVRRQQYFLTAAFRQVASVGILTKLNALGTAVKQSVYLDPGLDLVDLARQMERLSADNIISRTIPTSYATIDGADVLRVRPAEVKRFIASVIGTTSPTTSSSHAPSSSSASSSASPKAPVRAGASRTTPIDAKCIN